MIDTDIDNTPITFQYDDPYNDLYRAIYGIWDQYSNNDALKYQEVCPNTSRYYAFSIVQNEAVPVPEHVEIIQDNPQDKVAAQFEKNAKATDCDESEIITIFIITYIPVTIQRVLF